MAARENTIPVDSKQPQEQEERRAENPWNFKEGTYTEVCLPLYLHISTFKWIQFIVIVSQDPNYNQYWYSPHTISVMVEEIEHLGGEVAFLSTPSLYFSVSEQCRSRSKIFEFDKKWSSDSNFVFYDFNKPEELPESLWHTFDVAVVDPPFITEDVWIKYGRAVELLLRKHDESKVICTTIPENESVLNRIFSAKPTKFQPSIPHLVYQYNLFVNYDSSLFSKLNPEIMN